MKGPEALLFTIVADFRGGVFVAQVRAVDVGSAMLAWCETLRRDRFIPGASRVVARNVEADLPRYIPAPLDGLENVWCVSTVVGKDLVLINAIATRGDG